jgi:hypothetical protein
MRQLLFLALVSASARNLVAIGPKDLQLTAQPAQTSFSLHEPVVIHLTFTALENAKLTPQFELEGILRVGGYRIITNPEAKSPPPGLYQSAEAGEAFPVRLFFSDERTAGYSVLLNKWVEFDRPGSYRVTIEFPDARLTAVVAITITERDEARLQSACRELGEAANITYPPLLFFRGRQTANPARRDAQQALMYLREESLIPCLLQHASEVNVAPAIALREMDSVASVDALALLMQSPKDKLSAEARLRLGDLTNRTKKDDVRRAATAALQ